MTSESNSTLAIGTDKQSWMLSAIAEFFYEIASIRACPILGIERAFRPYPGRRLSYHARPRLAVDPQSVGRATGTST